MVLKEEDIEAIKRRSALAAANANLEVMSFALEGIESVKDLKDLVLRLCSTVLTLTADQQYLISERNDLMEIIDLLGGSGAQ